MRRFRDLKTVTKLLLGVVGLSLGMAAIGAVGLTTAASSKARLVTIYEDHLLGISAQKEANIDLIYVGRSLWRGLYFEGDRTAEYLKKAQEEADLLYKNLEKVEPTCKTASEKAKLAEIRELSKAYVGLVTDVFQVHLARGGRATEQEKLGPTLALVTKVDDLMTELTDEKEKLGEAAIKAATSEYEQARTALAVLVVGLVGLSLGAGLWVARLVARPLGQAVQVLEAVAGGDFTARLDVDTKDEVGTMAAALNRAVDGMRAALDEVRAVAAELASGSQQLSAAAEEISSGAQEQASSLEETASSLEEMTAAVKQNAGNAGQASQVAAGSRDVAEKGGAVVRRAVGAMGEIRDASKRIAEITSAIDEIAFQTNLLALNAAVEAARAGDQGRGFAVVASEVRTLAQRSATAAKEIKALIQDSVQKVEGGARLVEESGTNLEGIVTSVKRVTDLVGEIAAASEEQSSGIAQVNKAVSQMDQVTQANASQTEEMSATAESLAAQAEQLNALVRRFKLGDGAGPAHGPSRDRARLAAPARRESKVNGGSPALAAVGSAPAPSGRNGKNRVAAVLEGDAEQGFEEF